MDASIAAAGPGDRAELASLLAAQLAEHEIPIESARLAAAIDGALEDPRRGSFLLARREGRAVGVAYLSLVWAIEHGGRSAWLEELYVVPELRGRGLGARLLDAVLVHARELGCAAVDLEVEASHARAAALYRRAGFRPHQRARWVLRLEK